MGLKHTKGPWNSFNDKNGFTIDYADSNEYKVICQRNEMVDFKEQSANARLISCAPEMLDCMIIEVKIYAMSQGIEAAKQTKMCQLIEKATGLTIEEVLS